MLKKMLKSDFVGNLVFQSYQQLIFYGFIKHIAWVQNKCNKYKKKGQKEDGE